MKIETKDLKKLSSYAKERGWSRQYAYQLKNEGRIQIIEIDGVLFVRDSEKSLKNNPSNT